MPRLLARLELVGFKSFANKTVLDFSHGTTAIVGPNGSGKSNVVDAVRWLLGERDAKQLRGGTVEDLIFAGTPQRARVGQAQASIVFDNQSGFFPVDAPEVVITRTVRRDGTSTYAVNNDEVLLRDLIDLLARARLGARGLTVITQGNSDLFLQATPKGRREMIEEILGLREYQLKKKDAERRLRATEANLQKARALADELAPHVRSLKRQTSRWERRDQLLTERATIEEQYYGSHHALLTEREREVDRAAQEHREQRAGLEAARTAAREQQAAVEAQAPEDRDALKQVKEEIIRILGEQNVVQKEIGKLEAQLEVREPQASVPGKQTRLPVPQRMYDALVNVRTVLEGVLSDTGDDAYSAARLRDVVARAVEQVRNALADETTVTPATTNDEQARSAAARAALRQQYEALERHEHVLTDLQKKAAHLEERQGTFYEVFRTAVAAMETATHALEAWHDRERQLASQRERIAMQREDVLRHAAQGERDLATIPTLAPEQVVRDTVELEQLERQLFKVRSELAAMGEVDPAIVAEAREVEERHTFLLREATDLEQALGDLRTLITDLDQRIHREFTEALTRITAEFNTFFTRMFGGGEARLFTTKSTNGTTEDNDAVEDGVESYDEGVEVAVQLPKKRLGSLDVLSGGERSLVGIAALFALISVSPPPFLVLDEIDAPLDERNARRFGEMLAEFGKETQFILVTHNRATMESAEVLYGVTLDTDGSSKIVSLKLPA